MSRSFFVATATILLAYSVGAQTASQISAVQVQATVQAAPPSITLSWPAFANTTGLTIYRKSKSATSWGSAYATPSASATQYVDNAVTVGTYYEYKVARTASAGSGAGYIAAGVEVPATDYMGKIVLLVDNTLAPGLTTELATLELDLKAEGWKVLRTDVSRTASVSSIRTIVQNAYNADPTNVKAVYLLGHVPVPYSGNINPDGHTEHQGAWPSDTYYADVTGNWTDNTVNNATAQRVENRNVPGDGKFDQSDLPSTAELQIGRVDLYDMPAFSLSELELTRAYLNKAHSFKIKGFSPQVRGIVFDNFQYTGYPMAAGGIRTIAPLVGAANITFPNQNGPSFYTLVNNQSYLWTYSSGGGLQQTVNGVLTYNGANNVATTQNLAASNFNGVFNMSFGSYYGDWDNKNNFLRAVLGSGQALANCWAAIPHWEFHHMGLGDNIGYSSLMSNNNTTTLYSPIHGGWQGSIGKNHNALMGDPSLRMMMVAPPSNLTVNNSGGLASFSWTASPDAVQGYYLYQFDAATGAVSRVVPTLITATNFLSPSVPFIAGKEYMVRAVKLQTTASGSYYNPSLGAIATAVGGGATDCMGVPAGPAQPGVPCNDNNPCTMNDAWNAACVCVGATGAPVITSTGGSGAACAGQNLALTVAATGSGTLSYAWSGPNGFSSTSQNPVISGVTSAAAGNYTVTVTNSCGTASQTVAVTVTPSNSATINYFGGPFCTSASNVSPTRTGASGGTYSASPAGLSIVSNGNVTPSTSTPGTYTVTYTVPATGGCAQFQTTATVTIITSPSATISYAGSPFCTSSGAVSVTRTGTAGGSYTSSPAGLSIGGSTGTITPGSSTVGTYTVTYTITGAGCAQFQTTASVTISAGPSATISYAGSPFCTSGGAVSVTRTGTAGGSYTSSPAGLSISGSTGMITPSSSTVGTYTVTYTIAAAGGCAQFQAAASVTITAGPAATINYAGSPFCTSGGAVSVTRTGTAGGSYTSSPAGLSISGSTGTITPGSSTAGTYTVTYTIAAAGGCAQFQTTASVTITAGPSATINYAGSPFCTSGGAVSVTRTGTAGGSYTSSPAGLSISGSTGMITPSSSTVGTYTVTYTIAAAGGCAQFQTTASVTITAGPSATISYAGSPFCTSGGAVSVTRIGTAGGSYTSSPAGLSISGSTGTITPSSSTVGTYTVTYTIAAAGGCAQFQTTASVTITAGPSATISYAGSPFCTSGGAVSVTRIGTAGGSYTSSPAGLSISGSTGTITPGSSTAGTYTVTYTIAAAGGCAQFQTTASVMVTATIQWYADVDGDGAGDGGNSMQACAQPPGFVANANDGCPLDMQKTTPGACGCGNSEPGTICNDGNANTTNDVITAGCICAGTLATLDCLGVPNGTALPGTPCDDGLATTGNDVYQANCTCAGQLIDCLGVAGGTALPGTACDDNNANTTNDQWDANCQCAGTPVNFDCLGVPNGTALPGTACDDGDATTGNDVYQANCTCAGQVIDCLGVAGGSALPGTACDDNNGHKTRGRQPEEGTSTAWGAERHRVPGMLRRWRCHHG
ncbi:MAG: hypothetical protein IPO12_08390 [Flavobacteriales bacterium]|nr:hypothetical protein [Flavobacteriales bacterium]